MVTGEVKCLVNGQWGNLCSVSNFGGNDRLSGVTKGGMIYKRVKQMRAFVKRQIRVVETFDNYDD